MFAEHFGKVNSPAPLASLLDESRHGASPRAGSSACSLIKGHSIFPTRPSPQGHLIILITQFVSQLIRLGATEESLVKREVNALLV